MASNSNQNRSTEYRKFYLPIYPKKVVDLLLLYFHFACIDCRYEWQFLNLQRRSQAPPYFYRCFKDEVPRKVKWVDEIGSSFDVTFKKYEKKGYFTSGRLNVLMHYCLTEGAWQHMNYKGNGLFHIHVADLHTKQLECRRPAVIYEMRDREMQKRIILLR